jgi:glc operon protein GlcG
VKRISLFAACALALAATSVSAQDRRPGYGQPVSLAAAKKIAAGVIAECQKNSWNIAVAVVDPHGALLYFERMEDTQWGSNDVAIGKARTAAIYRRTTRVFADGINKGGPATATLGGVVASPGGVPIFSDGKVTGAVGVSGVTGDQDEQCAKAGLSAM